jgi:hypothetical protein
MLTIEINIDRWSTETERDQLIDALKGGRARVLVDRLRRLPALGHIATPTTAGWSLRFAQTRPREDGGRQVIVATDRPTTLGDTSRSRQDAAYDVAIVEIRLDKDGTGGGTLAYAASLTYEENTGAIAVANYGREPVRLTNVRSSPTP